MGGDPIPMTYRCRLCWAEFATPVELLEHEADISGGSPAIHQNAQPVSRPAEISGGGTPNEGDAVALPPPAAS